MCNEPFAAVAPSWAFRMNRNSRPASPSRAADYRIVVADGMWGRAEIAEHLAAHPW